MSKVQVDTIDTRSGTSTMQIGSTNTSTINIGVSGDTVNIPSGVTIANAGTATGFGAAGNIGEFFVYDDAISIANDTNTVLTGFSELFDADNWYASDKYTPQSAGKYFFHYLMRADNPGATPRFKISLRKNGSEIAYANAETNVVASSYPTVSGSYLVDANGSSDYFDLLAFQNSGGSTTLFQVVLMGFKLSS